ncbi:MAG: O-succinylhomoserine sulfhydrylase [Acidimicrobiaceae bacterium]|jgi:O-succinylhomoserine sulfhydrylase|nr:O-succinylhomoserine sulfhydrylase [Acidimicrobiaceae bacterium]MDC1388991.1 O-succinylhomoserine sulfhydrylase [Acidimicrobiales bacterium]
MTTERELREATLLVRGGLERTGFDETAEGLFLTSGYVYGSAAEAEAAFAGEHDRYIYSRYGNPTVSMFEERLRLIEGTEACMATASGMAAVFASLASFVSAGDKVVGSRALFGSCHVILSEILPRLGVETVQVDGSSLDEWEQALAGGARAVFLETPSNPGLEIIDLAAVSELAHAVGALVIVDNVFASPVLQKPLDFGADVVVYSATKHIDGQGRVLGGAVLSTDEFKTDYLMPFTRHTGPSLSPFNAWVLVKGLETMRLRVDAMSRSAHTLAEQLEQHPSVDRVGYPMLTSHPQFDLAKRQMSAGGTVLTIDVQNKERAFAFMDALELFDISNNVGDSKSLATHPATTTHRRIGAEGRALVGIGDGMIRLSIGLEDPHDLYADLDIALSQLP